MSAVKVFWKDFFIKAIPAAIAVYLSATGLRLFSIKYFDIALNMNLIGLIAGSKGDATI